MLPMHHHLKPEQSERYCLNTIRELFEKEGPSKSFIISELMQQAKWSSGSNFDRHTIIKHVDFLVAIGEVKKEQDHNQIKYRKNGVVLQEFWIDTNSPKSIRISLNELDGRKFVRVQRYETNESNYTQAVSGIELNSSDIENVVANLSKLVSRVLQK